MASELIPSRPLKLWAGILPSSDAAPPTLWTALVEKHSLLSWNCIPVLNGDLSIALLKSSQDTWTQLGSLNLNQLLGRESCPKIIARLTHSSELSKLKAFDSQNFICVPNSIKSIESEILENFVSSLSQNPVHANPPAPTRVKPKLLVHVCCGPDAAGVIDQLKEDFAIEMFWYDPNIQPKEEHDLRLQAFEKVCKITGTTYSVGEYDVENFEDQIKGLEFTPEQGAKCSNCYDMRLERAAREAQTRGFDAYTTTLAISPHKVQRKLEAFGALNEKKYGVPYYARNFMKHEGFKDSVEFTRKHEIFRQDYCGCIYSLWEGGPTARAKAELLGLPKPTTHLANPFLD